MTCSSIDFPRAYRRFRGRVIPLNFVAYPAMVRWASRFLEAKSEDYVFPACEAAGIEREHPDLERILRLTTYQVLALCVARGSQARGFTIAFPRSSPHGALSNQQKARPASKPLWLSQPSLAGKCWNTIRMLGWLRSGRRWTPSQSLFLKWMWHKIGHSRRQSKKRLPLTD
jgi:hypothetical protein